MAGTFGDVILVPFPFTDQTNVKRRPAVIVSSNGYNADRRDLIIMAITSQVRTPLGFGDALVADWEAAGLIKPSVLKPVFATIAQALILRTLGSLAAGDLRTLKRTITQVIG